MVDEEFTDDQLDRLWIILDLCETRRFAACDRLFAIARPPGLPEDRDHPNPLRRLAGRLALALQASLDRTADRRQAKEHRAQA